MDNSPPHADSARADGTESTESETSSSPAGVTDKPQPVDLSGVTCSSGIDPVSPAEDIATAQALFECPLGFKVCLVPPQSDTRSLLFAYGVKTEKVVEDTTGSPTKSPWGRRRGRQVPDGLFHCMASIKCRLAKTALKLSKGSSSPATEHLAKRHGLISKKGAALAEKKHLRKDSIEYLRASKGYICDKNRFITMHFVKTHYILGFLPFSYLEKEERRLSMELMNSEDKPYDTTMLNARGVKKAIVEMYDATKQAHAKVLRHDLASAPTRLLHMNVDLWTANNSAEKDKFIGIRVFYLTPDFEVKSFLLAVRQYKPGEHCSSVEAGRLVQLWAEHALQEFGLDWTMVAGATTDSGSEVKFAFMDIPGVLREWCIPHMLNRAIIDAFGLSLDPKKSKNPDARKPILEVRRIVEHINKSDMAGARFNDMREKKLGSLPTEGLRQAVPHRWVRQTVSFERFLGLYPDLVAHYAKFEDGPMAISSKKEIQEIYSLMKSFALIIQLSQSVSTITALTAVQSLVLLLRNDFNVGSSFLLHEASHFFRQRVPRGEKEPPKAMRTRKEHHELTATGRLTREEAFKAVHKRFGLCRWGVGYKSESHLFDMCMALNPAGRELKYISLLSQAPNRVERVKKKIWKQIEDRVKDVIVAEREKNEGTRGRAPDSKRLKISTGLNKEQLQEAMNAGIFDGSLHLDSREHHVEEEETPDTEAKRVINEWRTHAMPLEYSLLLTGEDVAMFWRTYGRKHFRLLCIVARGLLGAPASSAVLERDFGEVGKLVSHQRRSLGASYVEMVMYLRGAYDYIPETIPRLTTGQAEKAIPFRLRDPAVQQALAGLCVETPVPRDDDEGGLGASLGDSNDERELSEEITVPEILELLGRQS